MRKNSVGSVGLLVPVFLFLAGALMGCSTAHKRALEFMEKGLFTEAIDQYESILKRDPRDEDAVSGLRLAREGFLSRRLIDVRMARLAGNTEQSLDLLLESVLKNREWGMPPTAKTAFTQEEETEYAFSRVRDRVEQDLKNGQPLRAEFFLRKYEPLFTGKAAAGYGGLRSNTAKSGRESCKALQKEKLEGRIHFQRFVGAYCRVWNEPFTLPAAVAAKSAAWDAAYVKALVLGGKVEGLDAGKVGEFQQALEKALQKTAWFRPDSKGALEVNWSGRFTFRHATNPVPLAHVYKVSEPYTEYVEVTKERQVPYTETQRMPDALAPGGVREQTLTKYRTEQYKATEPRTKYKDVERTHHYRGILHEQSQGLSLAAKALLAETPFELAFNENLDESGIEHHENQPSIGIRPAKPEFRATSDWLREQAGRLALALEARSIQFWKDLYCPAPAQSDRVITGDHAHLCLKQTMAEYPAWVQGWYQANFGLDVKSAWSVMGRP